MSWKIAMKNKGTVKDLPSYDPDSPILSLCYTMPSWVGTLENVFMRVSFDEISNEAKHKLKMELKTLLDTAGIIYEILEDDNNA